MKALVLPARGIGDALLMMIASHRLLQAGYRVTTCHPALHELEKWFPGQEFISSCPDSLSQFDLVIAENDNSPFMHELKSKHGNVSIFYPGYSQAKNPPISTLDRIFNPNLSMAANISEAIASLLSLKEVSKENGIEPPKDLIFRRKPSQVLIHPMSSAEEKNWPRAKFLKLAHSLRKRGYQPLFVLSPSEREDWQEAHPPLFSTLDNLGRVIYESGFVIGNDSLVGHFASCLHIPALIIANDEKRMRLWRPDWLSARVITPPLWVPNMKGLRWRNKYWKAFISQRKVLSTFESLAESHR